MSSQTLCLAHCSFYYGATAMIHTLPTDQHTEIVTLVTYHSDTANGACTRNPINGDTVERYSTLLLEHLFDEEKWLKYSTSVVMAKRIVGVLVAYTSNTIIQELTGESPKLWDFRLLSRLMLDVEGLTYFRYRLEVDKENRAGVYDDYDT